MVQFCTRPNLISSVLFFPWRYSSQGTPFCLWIDKKVNFLEISISVIKVEAKSGLKNLTKPKVNLKPKLNSRQRHLLVIFVNRQFRKEIEDFITEIQ